MDPVSLTISLITLCGQLYTAIQSIKNAREDIKVFSEELAALQRTLESVHKAFGGKQSLVLSKLETEIKTCLTNLKKLAVKVKPEGWKARAKNTFNRSAWPLKEVETRQYIDQIYRLTAHLGLELQAYQTTMTTEETVKQENEREKEECRRRNEKRFEVLRWIHPGNCNDRHLSFNGGWGKSHRGYCWDPESLAQGRYS